MAKKKPNPGFYVEFILIGKWLDPFNYFDKKVKVKAEHASGEVTPVRLSKAEIRFLGNNLVVKSISD